MKITNSVLLLAALLGFYVGMEGQSAPVNATQLRGRNIATTGPAKGQVYSWNGTSWVPTSVSGTGTVTSISGPPYITWATSTTTPAGTSTLFATNAKTSTYQVLAADFASCKTIPVASGTFTITLVASGSQPISGQCITVINYGSGVVTIARSGQNINGGTSSLTLAAASATAPTQAYIVSDGTNYFGSLSAASAGAGVTSISTTSPLGGGTITSTGTLTCTTCTTNAAALTANLPVIGGGGNATAVGTRSGNTTSFATTSGSLTSGNCAKFDASGNIVDNGGACGSGGTGTVTVVGSGNLTSTALVTGGGSQALQTPAATATMDSSGNISTPGSLLTGVGGAAAGAIDMGQGTGCTPAANSVCRHAPASIATAYGITEADSVGVTGIGHYTVFGTERTEQPPSLIVNADITNATIDLTAKVTGVLPAANMTQVSPTAGTSVSLTSAISQMFVCTGTCTVTVPVPAAGAQYCVYNDDNVATVITLSAIGSSSRYENTARTAYGTSGTGTFVSGGAVGDAVCIVFRDTTHYSTLSHVGTWTAN